MNALMARLTTLLAAGLLLSGCATSQGIELPASSGSILLDADTANELDDVYAVAQTIADPHIELNVLTSSHFNNVEIGTKGVWHSYDVARELGNGLDTVGASQRENVTLLELMQRLDIPHPIGAREMIGFSWGYFDGAPVPEAPAVESIIQMAREASPERKADHVAVGPLTNIAAALIQVPDIAPNVRVWWLGAGWKDGVWNKNRFNVRNDLNAADYILDSDDIELIMMPTETARELMFTRERTPSQTKEYGSSAH